MDIQLLLKTWGLQELIPKLEENQINIDNLKALYGRHELIRELIPQIGLRLEFEEKIKAWIEHENPSETDSSISSVVQDVFQDTQSNLIQLNDVSFDLAILSENFQDFELKTLLNTSPLGKSILKHYEIHRRLNNTHQNRMVDIIVKHIYTSIVNSPFKHADYNKIASKIINLFPNEFIGTYYIPAVLKMDSATGRSQKAKGKLPNRVRNIRFLSGDTKKRNAITFSETNRKKVSKLEDPCIGEGNKEDWLWLKTNVEPWSSVIEKWQNTYIMRKECVYSTATEFYEEWPILKDLRADILVNLDFEKLYPANALNFFLHHKTFFKEIFEKRGNSVRDPYAIELLENIKDKEGDLLPVELFLLNHIAPPTGKIKLGTSLWKFSTLESIEGMFLHIKEARDVQKAIVSKQNIAKEKGRTVQPYLLFIGPSLFEVAQVFIIVDEIRYQFDNCEKALDILFKLFHVLNIKYPPESEHIYLIIQRGIYKISTLHDKKIPSIIDIIGSSCD